MSSPKRPSKTQVPDWLSAFAEEHPELNNATYWEVLEKNCSDWAKVVSVGPLWTEASARLHTWRDEFRQRTGDALLASHGLPTFAGKGAARTIEKCKASVTATGPRLFKPKAAPIPRVNDLVRTRVECKYLDGVEFLGDKLEDLARELNVLDGRSREGRVGGYFAQHLYFKEDVFFRFGSVNRPAIIKCEIQLATRLGTMLWEVSHPLYERWRGTRERPEEWQWNPTDPRFIGRQLGHMIHLADGLLVQLRDASIRPRISAPQENKND